MPRVPLRAASMEKGRAPPVDLRVGGSMRLYVLGRRSARRSTRLCFSGLMTRSIGADWGAMMLKADASSCFRFDDEANGVLRTGLLTARQKEGLRKSGFPPLILARFAFWIGSGMKFSSSELWSSSRMEMGRLEGEVSWKADCLTGGVLVALSRDDGFSESVTADEYH